ncbi:MAG TPA: hypothetical protein VJZ70_06310 [Limnochordia bacterium]|nr:hypothetical protein [Limnochordia bacterium]
MLRPWVKKVIIVLAVLLIAIVLAFRFFAEPPPPPASVPPSVQLLESRLVGRKDGFRQWEIWAQSVLQAGDVVTLTDLDEITMFQGDEPYLFIDAQIAVWDRKLDILHLHEAIVRDGDAGFYLESDFLIWAGADETLTSPGPVFILWEELEIQAAEMVMESKTSLLYLRGDVQIRDGSMVWRTDSAVYDLDHERMDFYGGLVLEEGASGNEQRID